MFFAFTSLSEVLYRCKLLINKLDCSVLREGSANQPAPSQRACWQGADPASSHIRCRHRPYPHQHNRVSIQNSKSSYLLVVHPHRRRAASFIPWKLKVLQKCRTQTGLSKRIKPGLQSEYLVPHLQTLLFFLKAYRQRVVHTKR